MMDCLQYPRWKGKRATQPQAQGVDRSLDPCAEMWDRLRKKKDVGAQPLKGPLIAGSIAKAMP
jgi:hypothetical protein